MDSTDDNLPVRKRNRLKDFNYASPSEYCITICSHDKRHVFGQIVDAQLKPSKWGNIAIAAWPRVLARWQPVELDAWVLMPNHFHAILVYPDDGRKLPPLKYVVNWYKGEVTKAIREMENDPNVVVWQRSYYDHVIRDERDLDHERQYLLTNAARWEDGKYVPPWERIHRRRKPAAS